MRDVQQTYIFCKSTRYVQKRCVGRHHISGSEKQLRKTSTIHACTATNYYWVFYIYWNEVHN